MQERTKARALLLKGALVWTGRGDGFHELDVAVRGSRIVAVGKGLSPEEGAEVEDLKGFRVTPGLIDAHTHIGVCPEGFPQATMADDNDMVDPVTPHLRALDALYPDDAAFEDALSGGVTCVQALPGSGNVIGGQGVVVKTRPDVVERMTVVPCSAMKAALGENPVSVYKPKDKLPTTRMGNAAVLRGALVGAQNYLARQEAARRKDEPAERDLGMEALAAVLRREMTLSVHCHRLDDIQTAVRIAEEFGLKYSLEHCTEGRQIAAWLGAKKAFAAVGPMLTSRSKIELRNQSWQNPVDLWRAGVHFCLITDHPVIPISNAVTCVALAVRAGLPPDEALRGVTLYAAEHLGLEGRLGSIEPGKDADLTVWDGDPLDARTHAVATYVDGAVAWRRP